MAALILRGINEPTASKDGRSGGSDAIARCARICLVRGMQAFWIHTDASPHCKRNHLLLE